MKTKQDNAKLEHLNFLIISHTYSTGPSQELRDYFINQNLFFSFLEHPFSFNTLEKSSKLTLYSKGTPYKMFKGIRIFGPDLFYFIKDFIYTIFLVIKSGQRYDICIAADNLNTFAAYFLKKIGYIKTLIYWSIDYTPQRFNNKVINNIYHFIDQFCCYHVDLIWNSSTRIKGAREKNGVNMTKCAPEIIVPDGCHFHSIKRYSNKLINRFNLVFMGHLVKNKGVDLIIKSLPPLIKSYPKLRLTIIGAGPEEKNLKKLAQDYKVSHKITFTGFIKDHNEVERMVAKCGIAIAPYVPDPGSFSFYSDVGKVKVYLACGLPVLITDVPEIARQISEKGAGMLFEYTPESFIKSVVYLLKNGERYFTFRKKAVDFIKNFDWQVVFNTALIASQKKLKGKNFDS